MPHQGLQAACFHHHNCNNRRRLIKSSLIEAGEPRRSSIKWSRMRQLITSISSSNRQFSRTTSDIPTGLAPSLRTGAAILASNTGTDSSAQCLTQTSRLWISFNVRQTRWRRARIPSCNTFNSSKEAAARPQWESQPIYSMAPRLSAKASKRLRKLRLL